MARIGFGDENANSTVKALAQQIRQERGGIGDLYRILLHSPPVAQGWLNLLTAVRQRCELPGRYREIVIIRIAILNGARYEHESHIPHALKEGLTQSQVDALAHWQNSDAFGEADRAVLAYTDAMTKEIQVNDSVFAAVRSHFDDRLLVELTVTIASYNLVSRFLEAFQIGH